MLGFMLGFLLLVLRPSLWEADIALHSEGSLFCRFVVCCCLLLYLYVVEHMAAKWRFLGYNRYYYDTRYVCLRGSITNARSTPFFFGWRS